LNDCVSFSPLDICVSVINSISILRPSPTSSVDFSSDPSSSIKNKVIDPVLAPMLRVPYGARDLLQADFERKQGQKIPAGKML
jgi:hypothetical protein